MNQVQDILFRSWQDKMIEKQVLMMDATCYEINMRFPTDLKIIWESCQFLWEEQIPAFCKFAKLKMPRSKFNDHKIRQIDISKKRKVGIKKTKRRIKYLLKLLEKGIETFQEILNITKGVKLLASVAQRFKVIKNVFLQQKYLAENHTTSVKNRIVSLSQPHIRPIVRGKENKPVEFGIKAHILQVNGLNIVEYHSFEAFNETIRLKNAYYKHVKMFGKCTHLAADGIYPTNKNRNFCSSKGLNTNFVAKGKPKKDNSTKKIKNILNIERGTRLEGSFGTEKEHYGLKKIKARTPQTQIVWMYFGIFTANVVRLANRQQKQLKKAA